jgi:hypothetical protein
MEKTPKGYIDLTRAEDLLDFFIQHNGELNVPDQKVDIGVPPQPGVPCPKCTYRNVGGQAYEISKTPLGHSFVVSKDTCDSLIGKSGKKPYKIDPAILNTLIHQNEYEEEHVAHVAAVQIPGIVVFMAFKMPSGPAVLCYLIDGTHRAVAALRAGRDFWAHVLVPKETLQCVSHNNGKPNPYFIGKQGESILWDGKNTTVLLP